MFCLLLFRCKSIRGTLCEGLKRIRITLHVYDKDATRTPNPYILRKKCVNMLNAHPYTSYTLVTKRLLIPKK